MADRAPIPSSTTGSGQQSTPSADTQTTDHRAGAIVPGQVIDVGGQRGKYDQNGMWLPERMEYNYNAGRMLPVYGPPQERDPSGRKLAVGGDGNLYTVDIVNPQTGQPVGGGDTVVDKYQPNPDNFIPPNYADNKAYYQSEREKIDQRQAATAADVNLGPVVHANQTTVGPMAQTTAPNLGAAAQTADVRIGPAGQATASLAGPAAQAQDSAVRGDLMTALQYQGGLMRGENSVAALQHKRLSDAALAQQMSMGASARPGMAAMAQRIAAQNMGRISGDMAGRLQEAQLAERNAAAQQYANLGGLVRGQDLDLGKFNAGETNTTGRLNAQLGTTTSIANAGNTTQTNIAQGQLSGQIGMSNTSQTNQRDTDRAQIEANVGMSNTAQANAGNLKQADIDQSNSQFNAGQDNNAIFKQADLDQNNNQFNATQKQGMVAVNDAAKAQINKMDAALDLAYQQGKISYEQLVSGKQENDLERKNAIERIKLSIAAGKKPEPSDVELILGAASDLLPFLALL